MNEVEAVARVFDPDAWHEGLRTDGLGAYWHDRRAKALSKAQAAIAALDAARGGEPVAWLYEHTDHPPDYGAMRLTLKDKAAGWTETPLYAHLPARGDVVARIVEFIRSCELSSAIPNDPAQIVADLALAIEAREWEQSND